MCDVEEVNGREILYFDSRLLFFLFADARKEQHTAGSDAILIPKHKSHWMMTFCPYRNHQQTTPYGGMVALVT